MSPEQHVLKRHDCIMIIACITACDRNCHVLAAKYQYQKCDWCNSELQDTWNESSSLYPHMRLTSHKINLGTAIWKFDNLFNNKIM